MEQKTSRYEAVTNTDILQYSQQEAVSPPVWNFDEVLTIDLKNTTHCEVLHKTSNVVLSENRKERDHLEDLRVDRRIVPYLNDSPTV
jgi:hypothetical protein